MADTKPLIGEVTSQFVFGKPEDFGYAIEAARVEQEAMVGYPLAVKSTRQTHYMDAEGRDVYEVFATFMPTPPPPPADATKA